MKYKVGDELYFMACGLPQEGTVLEVNDDPEWGIIYKLSIFGWREEHKLFTSLEDLIQEITKHLKKD